MKKFFFFLFIFLFVDSYAVTCAFESGREENKRLYSMEGTSPSMIPNIVNQQFFSPPEIFQPGDGLDAAHRNISPVSHPTTHYIPYGEELPFRLSP